MPAASVHIKPHNPSPTSCPTTKLSMVSDWNASVITEWNQTKFSFSWIPCFFQRCAQAASASFRELKKNKNFCESCCPGLHPLGMRKSRSLKLLMGCSMRCKFMSQFHRTLVRRIMRVFLVSLNLAQMSLSTSSGRVADTT